MESSDNIKSSLISEIEENLVANNPVEVNSKLLEVQKYLKFLAAMSSCFCNGNLFL